MRCFYSWEYIHKLSLHSLEITEAIFFTTIRQKTKPLATDEMNTRQSNLNLKYLEGNSPKLDFLDFLDRIRTK